ncbi:MAG: glycosyltransferase family 4 protein [Chitinispirillaceae bacterium]
MKRLLVTLDFPPEKGGIQHYLEQIVRHTFDSGDLVLVGCSRPVEVPDAFPCGVTYICTSLSFLNKKFSILPLFWKTGWCIKKENDSIVECGNVYAALVPFLLSFLMQVHYNVYTYGTELKALDRKGILPFLLKKVLRRAEKLYVLGSYTEKLLARIQTNRPVQKVPPRISLVSVREAKRENRSSTVLLNVARLVHHKGHDVLLEAVSKLPCGSDWKLVVVGEGPCRTALERQAERLGIAQRVEFAGRVDEATLEKVYSEASLFVFSSREDTRGTEGFGIVLLEAMSHHVPIVASRTGGIPEVLDNGSCGELVAPDDPEALANGILKLISSEKLRDNYVKNALIRLREHYVW